ncbi:transglutaminase-like superfamily domain-containing protein [Rhodopirellula maiorica SM1]|uniref:Transglutaminase-like superfamily domain-containing protein n=1 Tax=Rhodopirellula maiorica SM1 TaxID=1265738 RepID=M5RC41_9BACT|nr:transglutaminase family protein [Rhodopirellula maiorica]EMI16636.1 transglutaminase-like superfamily domain-containing protein [Rhodopirellula maiorica SM1]
MSMRVALCHHLSFVFHRQLDPTTLWLRLRPAPHTAAKIEAYSIKVHADPVWLTWARDPFENHLGRLDLPKPFSRVGFDVEFIADLVPFNPFGFFVEPFANDYPFEYPDQIRKELIPYLHLQQCGDAFAGWLAALDRSPRYLVEYLTNLNNEVQDKLKVDWSSNAKSSGLDAVIENGGGSPQDLAWVLTQSLRSLGLAARFTSGYLITLSTDGEGNISDDASADNARIHAWSEVFIPGAGWIGLDPSLGIFTAEYHVPLASAPDRFRTVPLTGIKQPLVESSRDQLQLRRLKPTAPNKLLSQTHYHDIAATGRFVDNILSQQKIALCSSAEVNFIRDSSTASPSTTSQSTSAGCDDRELAERLLARLKSKWAAGGAVHIGQGEHYRGESSARWRMSCCYRTDGHPLWFGANQLPGGEASAKQVSSDDAEQFATALATGLSVKPEFVIAAYEDRLHQLLSAPSQLNEVPERDELTDPLRRQRLAQRLSSPQSSPTGYVLPLRWNPIQNRWSSGKWEFRRCELYLLPGDFSMGFRLPLGSLSKHATEADEIATEPSQFEEKTLLPQVYGETSARQTVISPAGDAPEDLDSEKNGRAPRTALCVQPRDNAIHVFLPPIHHTEHYVELIAVIHETAQDLELPVVLEGYDPPQDARLQRFVIEPDRNRLRVALPAASSWQEQSELYETVFAEAKAVGLVPESGLAEDAEDLTHLDECDEEKVQRASSNTSLTLGGPTPSTSPFLKHPPLLRSLISYWQNHPCLSYLFSGTQIGPSGNAPRPDEGRDDALYELGIALERFPVGDSPHLWLPDRLLRHLLADASGNMHRAEIRVDTLYAPERQSRRLGQIMLQSFAMAPISKLASLQALLVRALVAHFHRRPYTAPLVRWESQLHDRFMLPQVLWDDFGLVIRDLNESGLPLQQDWFRSIFELNFPRLGHVQIGDITLELRRAHEPWPLLAEEVTGAGIARFIDVANERLQVRLSGVVPDRYELACNRQSVPLKRGVTDGEYVAGVRYKVTQPPSTLHPTIAAVTKLVFDLIDTWTGKSIGGCTYYPAAPQTCTEASVETPTPVQLPGGKPTVPPVAEPQSPVRVSGRFESTGSGEYTKPTQRLDRRFPYLLDLTKVAVENGMIVQSDVRVV